jgi:O-antigen/teichoic acid export membrane protein
MVKITYLYILGILLTVVVLWITVPFIYTFLGKDFQVGMNMVLYIALGFAFNGMYKMVSVYIFYLEKTWIIALITLGVAMLNVTLSVLLIPHYGAGGAAYSQMISMLILFLLTWLISSRLIKMPWNLKL